MYSIDKLNIFIKNKKGNSNNCLCKINNIKQYVKKKLNISILYFIFFLFCFLNSFNSFL